MTGGDGDGEKGIYRRSRYQMPLSIRFFRAFLLRSLFFSSFRCTLSLFCD